MNAECRLRLPTESCRLKTENARMAELVDALVSNTSGSDAVPVRSRLRVHESSLINVRELFSLPLFFSVQIVIRIKAS